jgi:UDP-2,3-diacylglucosamine pyrophosphatase LpxH
MIIAVSDIHIGIRPNDTRERRFQNFLIYLRENLLGNGDELVLLGDIFDFWRRDLTEVLLQSESIIEKLLALTLKGVKVHFVVGNHDYYINDISDQMDAIFETVGKNLVLSNESGSRSARFLFMHGYHLEVMANPYLKDLDTYEQTAEMLCKTAGITATLFRDSIFSSFGTFFRQDRLRNHKQIMMIDPEIRLSNRYNTMKLVERLAISSSRTLYLGINSADWFVFGHTHIPFLDTASRTINTGSWMNDNNEGYPYLVIDKAVPKMQLF